MTAAELSVWDVLKSPVVTEKSVLLKEASSEDENIGQILTFRVNTKAGKIAIRKAVEEIFSVKVARVRTVQYEGKMKKRGRYQGRRASWKKAYITLKKGEPHIDYAEAI
ncbi:MAG: 50S ribosomal protein L23 [Pyrinomonadaceae bacterium]|nr:50S ribosomal protein L23 [Pyrinomonadaceae bacterium]